MKSKGFTLVELLAVIILIGLIAVITIPKIKDSLDDSKKELAQTSAVNYSKQIDKLVLEERMKNNSILLDGDYNIDSNGNIYNEENEYVIDVSGKKPTGGTLTFSENDLQSGCITVNKYAVRIVNGEVTNITKGNCEYQSIEEDIIAIAQNYANSVKTLKGNVTNIFDVPVEGVTSDKVTAGWVALVEGEIDSYSLKIGAYVVTLANGNTIISKTTEISNKTVANADSQIAYEISHLDVEEKEDGAKYLVEAIEVYYNPTTGQKCNSNDSVSTTGTTTGCLHWYLYSVKGDYANMLLDHNITEARALNGKWISFEEYNDESAASAGITYPGVETIPEYGTGAGQSWNARGPVTALNTLKSLTNGWNGTQTPKVPNSTSTNEYIITKDKNANKYQIDYTGYKARLITKEEAGYLGCTNQNNACPEWMISGTEDEDSTTYKHIEGYWTSSTYADRSKYAWAVDSSYQWMDIYLADDTFGVRPVITVNINDVL